ncbi:GAF domain-containing protein [Chitinophaga sp. SYP-B3965]|uniref:GAF domain-containing protein n=1 Tax=Chitinophaga sp. SYP-B3965 TaxID=2663120 RepID=UPI001299F457|nr:GAF domain-containing protein [Chitinophaga sp. SYP-B3965]MRG45134.1 GAF domain-containing protein [Chitinophaga sp. SYP-B3965]
MQQLLIDFSGNLPDGLQIDTALSFKPFMTFLQKRIAEEKTVKVDFFKKILEKFEAANLPDELTIPQLYEHTELLEYLYASMAPMFSTEEETLWALWVPVHPTIVYGTESFYTVLQSRKTDLINRSLEDYRKDRIDMIYSFILKRFYNYHSPLKNEQYHAYQNDESGLLQYYTVHINTEFIEATAKGPLPELNFGKLHAHLTQNTGTEYLESILPLELFKFRGISVSTIQDVTAEKAVTNITKIRLNRKAGNDEEIYKSVIQSLKTLVCNSKIEFDIFPFLRVNGKMVYGFGRGGTGILYETWGDQRLTPETFQYQASSYAANPNSFFSRDVAKESLREFSFLQTFVNKGVRSLALMPVFHNGVLVGVLAMHTWAPESFDEKTFAKLEPAITPLGQLMQIYIDAFNLEIDNIIKEKFTSIQPSVQWKFNEIAWDYLYRKKKDPSITETAPIRFTTVYPLYGAIDIRNSTVERNQAIQADLEHQLKKLGDLFAEAQSYHRSTLLDGMIFSSKTWLQTVGQEQLTTTEEGNVTYFLQVESVEYLQYLATEEPKAKTIIDSYLKTIAEVTDSNKQALDQSMTLLNNSINKYLESEQEQLQAAYPCYFEKFRTDGIEYDIYIGQSIAPDRPFSHFHLKGIRLWQLTSMANIARLTKSMLPDMPKALHTTQLIFLHNNTIDISFRTDERKFDVEGAYNIRYEMIKKRIDKVHIRHTEERLTQPDKIALIYFNDKDVEDYLPYIHYLQGEKVLDSEVETLELEDLQGLTGLKALRVTVLPE